MNKIQITLKSCNKTQ